MFLNFPRQLVLQIGLKILGLCIVPNSCKRFITNRITVSKFKILKRTFNKVSYLIKYCSFQAVYITDNQTMNKLEI
ncbi:hypothetical protein BpHYR1_041605 [Brachionus plicatilis]|uniref:Uncharacterized protein n=1 Tax=Brachionus plicatilis TaxID=10195 RepID=A0A3M7QBP5_BRAPC|nr:hypothetical protein BpHYR1_041605 [Brachionus plicatilis]